MDAQKEPMEIDEFELLDFPNETLIKIFSYLDDCTLLRATQVSKRFAEVAQNAVDEKYDGSSEMNVYIFEEYGGNGEPERRQHIPFLRRFCGRIIAVEARFIGEHVRRDHWIFELIRAYCPFVTKVNFLPCEFNEDWYRIDLHDILPNLPKLAHLSLDNIELIDSRWTEYQYSSLVDLKISYLLNLEDYALKRFFDNNPQLESFCHANISFTIDAFDHTNLKQIRAKSNEENNVTLGELKIISMKNLVEICLPQFSGESTEAIAAGCKNIERIIMSDGEESNKICARQFEALFKFEKLKSLTIEDLILDADEVIKLITKLPKLNELRFTFDCLEFESNDIESIIAATKDHPALEMVRIDLCSIGPNVINFLVNAQLHKFFINSAKNELKMIIRGVYQIRVDVVITKEKLTNFGEVIRWVGYETIRYHDNAVEMNLLDLNDNCLNKIVGEIVHNSSDLFALYQTCRKMQQFIQPMFREKYNGKECHIETCNILKQIPYFGKYMSHICININDPDDLSSKEFWDPIYKYCRNNLVHLSVRQSFPDLKYLIDNGMMFTNLQRLLIGNVPSLPINKSKPLFCPRLTLLEFSGKYLHPQPLNVDFATELNNLTTLRFWRCSDNVLDFINALNHRVHCQLYELALGNVNDSASYGHLMYPLNNSIVNAIVRFTNIKSLILMLGGYNQANMKYLFENCPKLELLVLYHVSAHMVTLKEVKALKSCVKLQKIQFIVDRKNIPLDKIKEYFPYVNIEICLIDSWTKTIS